MGLTVLVDDNFHYMDENGRWELGIFPTWEEAVTACKRLVDEDLARTYEPGMSAEKLLDLYRTFGEDPFITGGPSDKSFSAWDYAKERCSAIAATT